MIPVNQVSFFLSKTDSSQCWFLITFLIKHISFSHFFLCKASDCLAIPINATSRSASSEEHSSYFPCSVFSAFNHSNDDARDGFWVAVSWKSTILYKFKKKKRIELTEVASRSEQVDSEYGYFEQLAVRRSRRNWRIMSDNCFQKFQLTYSWTNNIFRLLLGSSGRWNWMNWLKRSRWWFLFFKNWETSSFHWRWWSWSRWRHEWCGSKVDYQFRWRIQGGFL